MIPATRSHLVRFLVLALAAPAFGQVTKRVALDSSGAQADSHSQYPSISADGRFVAFVSDADNLVVGDTNAVGDAFVRDRLLGTTVRISVDSAGVEANEYSTAVSISADGRFVAFTSEASNLVAGDANHAYDVFVRDLLNGTTTCMSVEANGFPGNSDSGYPDGPSISADGRYVAFQSSAADLVAGDLNAVPDSFVRDRQSGATVRVSLDSSGLEGNGFSGQPRISAGGDYVVFQSLASNLVPGDTNARYDVFLRDIAAGTTERVSVGPAGAQGNRESRAAVVSADGRYVAFASLANTLVVGDPGFIWDVFLRDRQNGTTVKISARQNGGQANSDSLNPAMTPDGRYIAFDSWATNLVTDDANGDGDVFLRDRQSGTLTRVSLSSADLEGRSVSYGVSLSAHARHAAFTSRSSDLVPGDTNASDDVFVRVIPPRVRAH